MDFAPVKLSGHQILAYFPLCKIPINVTKNPVIYFLHSATTGKIYTGQTKSLVKRMHSYLYPCGRHAVIGAALSKYGVNDFWVGVVEECTEDTLDERERFWIAEFGCLVKNGGYNITEGGRDAGTRGMIVTEDQKAKQSLTMKGRYTGDKNPFYGKTHTEETRQRMRLSDVRGYTHRKSDISKNGTSKLTFEDVKEIRRRSVIGESSRKLAVAFSVSAPTILYVRHNKALDAILGECVVPNRKPKHPPRVTVKNKTLYQLSLGDSAWIPKQPRVVSLETRLKMSENHADFTGIKNPFFGKKHTESTLQKLRGRKAPHAVKFNIETKGRLVEQVDAFTGAVVATFPSERSAAKSAGVSLPWMQDRVAGRQIHKLKDRAIPQKYIWRHATKTTTPQPTP